MKTLITALALGLATAPLQAASWRSVDAGKSHVAFAYRQMGVGLDGQFRKFSAQLDLDTAHVDKASGRIDIDMASVDTGSAEADGELVTKSWFNVAAHPRASFVLARIRPTAPNQYEATGQLQIKGTSRDVQVPLKLDPQGLLSGSVVIRRGDYGIGEGPWAKFDVVANDITVTFKLQLK
ncbi:MAG: Protein YceI [Pseudomonadota bacterium]|jgi:polyisoprenoid-binding protein YceI